jgi:hypothetical protein
MFLPQRGSLSQPRASSPGNKRKINRPLKEDLKNDDNNPSVIFIHANLTVSLEDVRVDKIELDKKYVWD